ncbi:MAG: DUF2752 domain-containing protein [Oscillatoriophycideae cyanobacterium NC_groundwater_1537_Pr4_S-0.65um_50_18]|nr:DUF2752 domain-containing protein [Oscillatoriophycideae cyanobacterium NC_groundwater_1537_Pr4_S-0.65um_50_18]
MTEELVERSPLLLAPSLRMRWAILGLSLTPVVGAFLYNLGLRFTPQKCFFQQMLSFPSPACGMTRSFMAIAQGNWQQALSYHLFAPLLFSACLITAAHTTLELIVGHKIPAPYARSLRHPMVIAIGILLFFVYYALRLYARYSDGMLPFDLGSTIVWQHLTAGAKAL